MNNAASKTVISCLLFITLAAGRGAPALAAPKTIAVLDIVNTAHTGDDKFYGESQAFSHDVATLISLALAQGKDLKSVNYSEVRQGLLEYEKSEARDTQSWPLDFAKAMGYDYAVRGTILEAKVKTSKKRLSLDSFNKKNFTIWSRVSLSVYDVATGEIVLTREYRGDHFESLDRDMMAMHLEFTGIKKFEPQLEQIRDDPKAFGRSCLGMPFTDISTQFASDLSREFAAGKPTTE